MRGEFMQVGLVPYERGNPLVPFPVEDDEDPSARQDDVLSWTLF